MKHILIVAAMLFMLNAQSTPAYTQYSASFNQSAFVPDISLILDGSYLQRNIKNSKLEAFTLQGAPYANFVEFNTNSGFNLNYAELALHSAVDQAFDLDGVFHFSPEGVEIEEGYFTTRTMPWQLRLKGGKFKSDFGYLNSKHQHVWDFADAPLVYNAFLGAEGLNGAGLQLHYLMPTPWYMLTGIETMQSLEEGVFSNQTFNVGTTTVTAAPEPSLLIAYVKNSVDIDDTTLLLGLNVAHGANKDEESNFDGSSTIYDADFLVKSYLNSYSYIKWQSELLFLHQDGHIVNDASSVKANRAGLDTQLIYAYNQNWRYGLRYDSLFKDNKQMDNRDKYTIMAEYNPSEFSRIRAQFSHNRAFVDAVNQQHDINEFIVEINLAIGAHGAHSF